MKSGRYDADLLSRDEAVQLFGVPARTIRAWENSGRLTSIRLLTGQRRYRRGEVAALVEEMNRRLAAAEPEPVPEPPPEPKPPTRLDLRRRALEALHASDVAGEQTVVPVEPLEGYARALFDGVVEARARIDEIIESSAERWSLERMPVVDRNILRLAVYELLYTDVPTGAIVDQAVELAKLLSTEGSGRFVNGLLGRIARDHR